MMKSAIVRNAVCSALLGMFLLFRLEAQTKSPTQKEVLRAVNDAATYASTILLDENGKSRCEYNLMEGAWVDYEPAWHTGQIINGLVEAYKLTKKTQYLSAAKKGGDWWIGLQIKDHPKLKGMLRAIHYDGINNIVCATITDGTPGLFNLSRATKEKKYADVATSAGEWMMRNMYLPTEGMLYDLVDPVSGEVLKENSPFWPDKTRQTLNDVARPNNEGFLFKEMYEYTGNEKYKEVFVNLCESLVAKQGPEGFWMQFTPNNLEKGTVHPRFNLWYAESLIEGYVLTGKKEYLEAAKRTVAAFMKFQKKDGTIYYENRLDGSSNQNSVTGSAVALGGLLCIRLQQLGVGDEFKDNIERSARWLVTNRFSPNHPDRNVAGGTVNTRTRTKSGAIVVVQRDIGTAFSLRFLAAYHQYKFGAGK